MTTYEWADTEVEPIAKALIAEVKDHEDLVHARILYVFRDKHALSRGHAILGKARKVAGLTQFLVDDESIDAPLFVLEFPRDLWKEMTDQQRRALVDHELSHLAVERNDDGIWVGRTRGHDVEEFLAIVKRHGLWKADVQALAKVAAGQLALDLDDPAAADDEDEQPTTPASPDDEEWERAAPGLRVVPDPFAGNGAAR
ncbi:MAG: hypothetical protein IE926_16775 [Micrococcales bacterium]|nr:hypothetical protein [Micrococcales bacterium]